LQFDAEDGTNYWRHPIIKEMSKVKVTWKIHDSYTPDEVRHGKVPDLIGFQEIQCHCVLDVKMDFTKN
jgi:hypothetical protein